MLCCSELLLSDDCIGRTQREAETERSKHQQPSELPLKVHLCAAKLASVLMVEPRSTGPLSTLVPDEHLARASACFSLSLWRTMASQPRQSLTVCS